MPNFHICHNFRYLHSTMYLLNPDTDGGGGGGVVTFTFHYVSIKSKSILSSFYHIRKFTFHYVSIKSNSRHISDTVLSEFTFHYVSIKSRYIPTISAHPLWYLHSTMYLLNHKNYTLVKELGLIYIPLCIY